MNNAENKFIGPVPNEITVFVPIQQSIISNAFLIDILKLVGATQNIEIHAERLLSRNCGRLSFRSEAKRLWHTVHLTLSFTHVLSATHMPAHTIHVGESKYRWTMDIFNPGNDEYQLPNWKSETAYLQLIVSQNSFQPYLYPKKIITEEQEEKYKSLNRQLTALYFGTGADFLCGGMLGTVSHYLWGPNYATRWPGGEWTDFYWPWLVYSPQLRRQKLSHCPDGPMVPPAHRGHPCRFIRSEPLEDGGILMWAAEVCVDDEKAYAKALGVKPVFGLSLKRTPQFSSW